MATETCVTIGECQAARRDCLGARVRSTVAVVIALVGTVGLIGGATIGFCLSAEQIHTRNTTKIEVQDKRQDRIETKLDAIETMTRSMYEHEMKVRQ